MSNRGGKKQYEAFLNKSLLASNLAANYPI